MPSATTRAAAGQGLLLMLLGYLGFISLGLPDGLLGVAWPSIRREFGLEVDALGVLLLCLMAGYIASSFASGRLLQLMSVGSVLAASCAITGISLAVYALTPMWSLMVGAALIGGLGAGAVDAGLNTFAATYYSTRAVNWLHACYGVGATAGPAIMTGLIMAQHPWQSGYGLVAASQLALALAFLVTRRRWSGSAGGGAPASVPALTLAATLRRPVVWLSMTVFFVYTGLEAAAGLWCFTLFTEGRGFPVEQAGTWVSLYWGSLTVGRITLGFVAPYVAETRLLRSSLLGLMAGSAVLWLDPEALHPALGLVLMGFSAAAVFPTLIAMTARRLGSGHRANAIGFQMASAVFGGALLPAGLGLLAGQAGLAVIAPALAAAAALLFVLHELLNAPTVPTPD